MFSFQIEKNNSTENKYNIVLVCCNMLLKFNMLLSLLYYYLNEVISLLYRN